MIAGTAPLVEVVMEGEVVVGGITTMVIGGMVVATIVGGRMGQVSGLSSNSSRGPNLRRTNPQLVMITEFY
jgi:hypothetical protein